LVNLEPRAEQQRVSSLLHQSKKSGELFFIEQIIRPFVAPDGSTTHYVWTGRDISQRVSALRQLAQQANHDDLTGLSNRNLFMDRLSQAFSQASRRKDRFALLYVDLDEFKEVNDRQGHAAGDELLRTAARRLRQSVREVDTVARLGGDEFALILPDAKQREDVEKVAQKILQAFQVPVIWQNKLLLIRASIGASLYPENADSCEQLLHHADHAMYQQKIGGGNGVSFFRQPMNATDEAAYLML
jgi:diguanylate cyclase (GGDEF)-like protein